MRRVAVLVGIACLASTMDAAAMPAMTKSQADQLVHSVQLTTTDLPGFDEAPPDSSGSDSPLADARFARCAGTVPTSKELADANSNTFSRTTDARFEQIGSEALVYPNARLVKKDMKAAATKRARKCLLQQLRRQPNTDPTTKVVGITVAALKPAPRNGVALRVKTLVESQGHTVPVFTDALVVGIGQVEVGVIAVSGPVPSPRSEENDLLAIVRSRVNGQLASGGIF